MHLAARFGFVEAIQVLLDNGANINILSLASGGTPLHLAAGSKNMMGGYADSAVYKSEIQERQYPHRGNVKTVREERLLCEFTHNGSEYRVTPEASHIAGFQSQYLLQEHLSDRIHPDYTCELWVDPRNPLHAVFDKKQWI